MLNDGPESGPGQIPGAGNEASGGDANLAAKATLLAPLRWRRRPRRRQQASPRPGQQTGRDGPRPAGRPVLGRALA